MKYLKLFCYCAFKTYANALCYDWLACFISDSESRNNPYNFNMSGWTKFDNYNKNGWTNI